MRLVFRLPPGTVLWGRPMRIQRIVILCAALAGCTGADSHAFLPGFMRDKEPAPAAPEKPPVVAEIVRAQLDTIFVTSSSPRKIQVSPAHRDTRTSDWIACVKAEVNSATGKPIGVQTYRITIVHDQITDRRQSTKDDTCASEGYQPI